MAFGYENGKLLCIIKREDLSTSFDLPGGGSQNSGEGLTETLRRVVLKRQATLTLIQILGFMMLVHEEGQDFAVHHVMAHDVVLDLRALKIPSSGGS